ncbi:hypothetical protein GCM10025857_35530 [Alicyclobacillus contaminans]|uniref:hypothetical protein n=1 Tax=Alicyclobacillus contaminans TaxID=392016 RepID=UPI00040CD3AB|nr:hypothetical protein [Alicyclobacillus contaminans]GMA52196.1 hypothetical protein GCM10025857_35530 [Alicyclobacillus contaminans]
MRKERKTIPEWEKELHIQLLDLDGFHPQDDQLMQRKFTRREFEIAAAECTIRAQREGWTQQAARRPRSLRRALALLILFPLPTACVWIFSLLYGLIRRMFGLNWKIPAVILLLDALIFIIQPMAVLVSGPLYPWYHIADSLHHILAPWWAQFKFHELHQSLNLAGVNDPLFHQVTIFQTPLNLYFGLPQAVTSALWWGSFLVSLRVGLFGSKRKRLHRPGYDS